MHAAPKIFGIGLSRTGTTSLSLALELLGFRAIHFPSDPVTRMEIVSQLDRGNERLSLSILEHADALTDTPVCCTYQALDRAYPGSKFILTVRDEEAWVRSCVAYWTAGRARPVRRQARRLKLNARHVAARLSRHDSALPFPLYVERINRAIFGVPRPTAERFRHARQAYEAAALEHFSARAEDLLVIDICAGEGWDILCPFLGVAVPDVPFPAANRLVHHSQPA